MASLLKAFVDIATWRRGPADLPESVTLLGGTIAAYAACTALQSWLLFGLVDLAGRTAADVLLTAALLWLVLRVTRRGHRFRQTATAVFGTGALLAPLVILLLAVREPATAYAPLALLVWVASAGVIVWFVLIVAHILRAALDTGLFTAMAVSVAYVLGSALLLEQLFPSGA